MERENKPFDGQLDQQEYEQMLANQDAIWEAEEIVAIASAHNRLAVSGMLVNVLAILDQIIDQITDTKTVTRVDEAWILLEQARQDIVGPEYNVKRESDGS